MRSIAPTIAIFAILVLLPASAVAEEKLSMEQMRTQAETMIKKMRAYRDSAEADLRKARSDRDMAQLDRINDSLIALKGLLRLAEDYLYDLKADFQQQDRNAVQSSYTKIRVAYAKAEELAARIRSFGMSDEGVVEGEPVIERIVDPDLPDQDPLEGLESDDLFIERPPMTSPDQ